MSLVAAAALLLIAVFYRRAYGALPWKQWQLLLLLRWLAAILVVVLLFRPVYSHQKELVNRPGVVFLVDHSKSMSIADDASGLTRSTLARQQIEKWWTQLADDFTLRLVAFAETARPLERVEELGGLAPDGAATSITAGLRTAAEVLPQKEIEAVVLVSDGLHNAVGSPVGIADKLGVVVHAVGVGASLRANPSHRDVQVTGIDCPERMMLKNKAQISASVEAVGLGGFVTKALLKDEDQQIAEQEITLDDAEGGQRVSFEFIPTQKGKRTYTVEVPPAGDEKIVENNKRSAVSLVIEPGIRALYLEGTLRAEYGAVVDRFLAKDPDLEFCALVQVKKNFFLNRTNIPDFALNAIPTDAETLAKFDVFIIGDLDATFIKPEVQRLMVKRVQDGAGLLMMGGYHALGPGGYEGSPLGEILPVRLGGRDIGQATDPFLPMLTPEGVQHPIFSGVATFFPTRQTPLPKTPGLPPLDGCTRVAGAKPGAALLAVHPLEAALPVIAVQPVDKGRSMVFCGDTTRKWQQGPRALDQDSPFLQFWGQTVRWLAGRAKNVENEASVVAHLTKAAYEPGEPVRIDATVRDQKGEATNDALVEARVTGPSGRPEAARLSIVAGPTGNYSGQFEPQESGAYRIVVEARVGELRVKSEELTAAVGRANLEFDKLDLNEKLLAAIASAANGRYMHISAADKLNEQLNKAQRKKQEYIEKPLYWPVWMWGVFVAALTLEWALRRRFQLR